MDGWQLGASPRHQRRDPSPSQDKKHHGGGHGDDLIGQLTILGMIVLANRADQPKRELPVRPARLRH
eukprot:858780-Lingulodinium_polyedra.AAC.1